MRLRRHAHLFVGSGQVFRRVADGAGGEGAVVVLWGDDEGAGGAGVGVLDGDGEGGGGLMRGDSASDLHV